MKTLKSTLLPCLFLMMAHPFFAQDELAVVDESKVLGTFQMQAEQQPVDEAPCAEAPETEAAGFLDSISQNWLAEGLIVSGVLLGYFFFRKKLEYEEEESVSL